MFFKQVKKLLPKKLADRVALKTPASQHLLSKFRGLRKQTKVVQSTTITKISFGVLLLLYFGGYQPTLTIPPIRQTVVRAEFTQKQAINSERLSQPFQLPHPGYLTTSFSSWHPGIDLATGLGMPIHPVLKGKVIETAQGFWGLGHYVVVEHEQGFKSTYGHMGKIFVKKDNLVDTSSILGEVGMSGHTTGPHTHLEITKNDQYINPQTILPVIANWPDSAEKAPNGGMDQRPPVTKLPHLLLSQEALPSSQIVPSPY